MSKSSSFSLIISFLILAPLLLLIEQFNNNIDIHYICRKYKLLDYTISDDGKVNVDNDVDLSHQRLTELPLQFGKVTGNFNCSWNKLTTLKGSPSEVGGDYICLKNELTSLDGATKESNVGGKYDISFNKNILSLKGTPEKIGDSTINITSLEGKPNNLSDVPGFSKGVE